MGSESFSHSLSSHIHLSKAHCSATRYIDFMLTLTLIFMSQFSISVSKMCSVTTLSPYPVVQMSLLRALVIHSNACNHRMHQIFSYLLCYMSFYLQIETFLSEVGVLILCTFLKLMSSSVAGIKQVPNKYLFLKIFNIFTLLYLATYRIHFTFSEFSSQII